MLCTLLLLRVVNVLLLLNVLNILVLLTVVGHLTVPSLNRITLAVGAVKVTGDIVTCMFTEEDACACGAEIVTDCILPEAITLVVPEAPPVTAVNVAS